MVSAYQKAKAALDAEAARAERTYTPRGAMAELWTTEADEFILSGPAGTGKSRGCLEYIHDCALRYPGSRQLIARKTRVSLTESGLVTFERQVVGEHDPLVSNMQRANRALYSYPNGSEIIVGGIDRPGRIMSTEFDQIYVQEATELQIQDYEALTSRLRGEAMPYSRMIGDCNPDRPDHWLKLRAEAGACSMRPTLHQDNPRLYDDDGQMTEFGRKYLAKLNNLTGVRRDRLLLGLWVQAEGAVYDDWNDAIHYIDRFDIPAEWRRIRSIDFGFTNPFTCGWWAIDPDGRMYRYREIYHTQRTVAEHAAQITRLSEGERIEATIADHDAEDRATLAQHGIHTIPARKSIRQGIEAVQERLKLAGDGKPRIFILRDSLVERDDDLFEASKPTHTAAEIGGYVWAKGADGKPKKEVPVDVDNHGLDDLRYAVMYVDQPRARSRPNDLYD